eukprot:GHVU01232149.1.p1 GENE.GHVU01232149.1~~GHVU01232149.1.p1  ORF type:complete len:411 (+),score=40.42 GHVU01232149.1:611-1843(+)
MTGESGMTGDSTGGVCGTHINFAVGLASLTSFLRLLLPRRNRTPSGGRKANPLLLLPLLLRLLLLPLASSSRLQSYDRLSNQYVVSSTASHYPRATPVPALLHFASIPPSPPPRPSALTVDLFATPSAGRQALRSVSHRVRMHSSSLDCRVGFTFANRSVRRGYSRRGSDFEVSKSLYSSSSRILHRSGRVTTLTGAPVIMGRGGGGGARGGGAPDRAAGGRCYGALSGDASPRLFHLGGLVRAAAAPSSSSQRRQRGGAGNVGKKSSGRRDLATVLEEARARKRRKDVLEFRGEVQQAHQGGMFTVKVPLGEERCGATTKGGGDGDGREDRAAVGHDANVEGQTCPDYLDEDDAQAAVTMTCMLCGAMRINRIRVNVGDRVYVHCSPSDLKTGRIVQRIPRIAPAPPAA